MKKRFVFNFSLLCALMLLVGCSGWSRKERLAEGVFLALNAADWSQTRRIADDPGNYRELNPILGAHPSSEDVDLYFAATSAAHVLLVGVLPRRCRFWGLDFNPRDLVQFVSIGASGATVAWNINMGLGW